MSAANLRRVTRVTLVIGTSAGGTGAHVRMLARGLTEHKIKVTIAGPEQTGAALELDAIPDVAFTAVEFGDRPRPRDVKAILELRRLLTADATRPDVVHAHGMRAGALTAITLAGTGLRRAPGSRSTGARGAGARDTGSQGPGARETESRGAGARGPGAQCARTRGPGGPKLVVTVHNAPPDGGGAARLIYRTLERIVARRANVVLGVSPDLEQRMRAAGARRVARAVVPAPPPPDNSNKRQPDNSNKFRADNSNKRGAPENGGALENGGAPGNGGTPQNGGTPGDDAASGGGASSGGVASGSGALGSRGGLGSGGLGSNGGPDDGEALDDGRPLVLAVGRLARQKDFGTLIEAARAWQHRSPKPRLLIAGDGPLRAELVARARERNVDAEFPGHRSDVPALLSRAAVFVMPSRWEGQPLALAEALRAGVPVVASDAGGIKDLVGDAALLLRPGGHSELAQAVLSVLDNHDLAARLSRAGRRRAADLPGAEDAVTAVLSAYASALE